MHLTFCYQDPRNFLSPELGAMAEEYFGVVSFAGGKESKLRTRWVLTAFHWFLQVSFIQVHDAISLLHLLEVTASHYLFCSFVCK
jgi:hypothetical protein